MISRRVTLAAAMTVPFIRPARAAQPLRIGCLTDLSGPYSDLVGLGTVNSIKLAIQDFGALHPDVPVELVVADFSLKPDTGLSIMREWFDNRGVDAIIDVPLSALALGAVLVLQDKNKVGLFTSPATGDLTRASCGPNHVHFAPGTYCLAASMVRAIVEKGGDTWFFIAPDYAMGKSMVTDGAHEVERAGGRVLGSVSHPFPGTHDFSSFLLGAQSSGAKVICLTNAGEDAANCVKQAREFNILGPGKFLAAPFLGDTTVHALGLADTQSTYWPSPFYWDRNDRTRAFAARLSETLPARKPNKECANAYSGALHYLKAAAALGVEAAKADGRRVVQQMKAMEMDDALFGPTRIREDGQTLREMLLLQVKTPAESKGEWDLCKVLATVGPDGLYVPLNEGGCRMVRT